MVSDIQVFRDSDLALIRRTVAKDCLPHEFDQFIHIARAVRLDPLRRQLYAFVFGKGKDDEDRQLTVVTGIDGYRSISERSGCYRPADRPTLYETDPSLKSPSNPHGIIRAEVTLYKFAHGDWHPVVGEAFWDEYVPTKYRNEDVVWTDTGKKYRDSGKPIIMPLPKDGAVPIIDPSKTGWAKAPRNQISKCAEAQAHRKGWPNDFAGLEVQEEVDRRHAIDLTASEAADYAEQHDRVMKLGGPDQYIIDWMDGSDLASVHGGKLHDQVMAFIDSHKDEPLAVKAFRDRNRHTLASFWAAHKSDALNLKSAFERLEASETAA